MEKCDWCRKETDDEMIQFLLGEESANVCSPKCKAEMSAEKEKEDRQREEEEQKRRQAEEHKKRAQRRCANYECSKLHDCYEALSQSKEIERTVLWIQEEISYCSDACYNATKERERQEVEAEKKRRQQEIEKRRAEREAENERAKRQLLLFVFLVVGVPMILATIDAILK